MVKRLKKRDIKKALKELMFEPAPLSNNKGRLIMTDHCPNKINAKERRHRGWVTAHWGPGKYKEEIAAGNDPTFFYDAWRDFHDGIHHDPDMTHIRSEFMNGTRRCQNCHPNCWRYNTCEDKENPNPIRKNNQKLLKQVKIREAKKKKRLDRLYL